MVLDHETVGLVGVFVLLALALPISVSQLTHRSDGADFEFVAALGASFVGSIAGYLLSVSDALIWSALDASAYVVAFGCVWCLAAKLSGKSTRWRWYSVAGLAVMVTVAPFVDTYPVMYWRGGVAYLASTIVVAFAVTVVMFRGDSRSLPEAKAIGWLFFAHGLFFSVRLLVFVTIGPSSEFFTTWLGSAMTTLVSVMLFVSSGYFFLSLRRDIALRVLARQLELDPMELVLSKEAFRSAARALLSELEPQRRPATVVHLRIESLHDIRVAYGSTAADSLVRQVVAAGAAEMPASSLAMQHSPAQLVWLVHDVTFDEVREIVDHLGARLMALQVPGMQFLYGVSVGFGLAQASTVGYDVDALLTAAHRAARPSTTVLEPAPEA